MMNSKRYRILGLDLSLSSDCEAFAEDFDADYALFAAPEEPGDRHASVVYLKERAALMINGASRSLGQSSSGALQAYQMVTAMLMKETPGFFILHGGVAARNGRALVVSGPSGSGKTTLVTALLEAGFQFLSDDFCPIHEETRLVHPFPRTMWRVHPGGETNRPARRGKEPVPVDPLKARLAPEPCRIGGVIYIDPGPGKDPWCTTRVELERRGEEAFLAAAAGLTGVTVERLHGADSRWEIKYRKKDGHVAKAVGLLKAVEPYTIYAYRVDAHDPDFLRDPSLARVPVHEMAHILLRELKSEPDGLRVKPGEYFMKLSGLLADAPCWRLTTGGLEKMRDLAMSALTMASNCEGLP
jgi:hypothetical protein